MNMKVSDFNIGFLWAVYGLLQMITSPIVGKISDSNPRFLILLSCLVGTALSYSILLLPNQSIILLLISRILSGSFKHSRSLFKAIIAIDINLINEEEASSQNKDNDIKDKGDSTLHRLASLNAISNVGFVIGPVLMTFLDMDRSKSLRPIIKLACMGYVINIVLVLIIYVLYQKSLRSPHSMGRRSSKNEGVGFYCNPTNWLPKFHHHRNFCTLMTIRFLMVAAILVFRHDLYRHLIGKTPSQNPVAQRFTSTQAAYIFSLSSAFSSIGSFIAVFLTTPWTQKRFFKHFAGYFRGGSTLPGIWLYKVTSFLYAASMLWTGVWVLALSSNNPLATSITAVYGLEYFGGLVKVFIMAGILCNSISNSWCRTLLDDLTLKYSAGHMAKDDRAGIRPSVGELIGTGQSVSSFARIMAPLIAGTCQEWLHFDAPLMAGGLLALAGVYVTSNSLRT